MGSKPELEEPSSSKGQPLPNVTKTKRRHGACKACQLSKQKCDGDEPCGACRRERKKPRTCDYNDKARAIDAARKEGQASKRLHEDGCTDQVPVNTERDPPLRATLDKPTAPALVPSARDMQFLLTKFSLCKVVDEFIAVQSCKPKAKLQQLVKRMDVRWQEIRDFLEGQGLDRDQNLALTSNSNTTSIQDRSMVSLWKQKVADIWQQINSGNMIFAWSTVPALLREIEAWEMFTRDINHYPLTEEFKCQVDSICLELLELDCYLALFLGGQVYPPAHNRPNLLDLGKEEQEASASNGKPASKVHMFSAIQSLLKINMTTEAGLHDFLRHIYSIQEDRPAPPVQSIAICTTNEASGEQQVLKLISNLLMTMMYCRTATACEYYSREEQVLPASDDGEINIVQHLNLHLSRQKSTFRDLINKYAGTALEAFEKLCELHPETTANSWFLLFGGLTAAVMLIIAGTSDKAAILSNSKKRLTDIQHHFQQMKAFNPTCPLFDIAVRILQKPDQAKRHQVTPLAQKRKRDRESAGDSSTSEDRAVKIARKGKRHMKTGSDLGTPNSNDSAGDLRHVHKGRRSSQERAERGHTSIAPSPAWHDKALVPADDPSSLPRLETEGLDQCNDKDQSNPDLMTSFSSDTTTRYVESNAPPYITDMTLMTNGNFDLHRPLSTDEEYYRIYEPDNTVAFQHWQNHVPPGHDAQQYHNTTYLQLASSSLPVPNPEISVPGFDQPGTTVSASTNADTNDTPRFVTPDGGRTSRTQDTRNVMMLVPGSMPLPGAEGFEQTLNEPPMVVDGRHRRWLANNNDIAYAQAHSRAGNHPQLPRRVSEPIWYHMGHPSFPLQGEFYHLLGTNHSGQDFITYDHGMNPNFQHQACHHQHNMCQHMHSHTCSSPLHDQPHYGDSRQHNGAVSF